MREILIKINRKNKWKEGERKKRVMHLLRRIYTTQKPRTLKASTSASTTMATQATSSDLETPSSYLLRFQEALESVYGSISTVINPETWTPPPNSGGHRGRYLWTDAFGVLNLITLSRAQEQLKIKESQMQSQSDAQPSSRAQLPSNYFAESDKYLTLARRLVETVHDVLGWTRDGRSRLPGATDSNPLGGGLRIGKMDERGPDGDGQYHHYLTIWMFALNRLSLATKDPKYNRQAVELAKAIHPCFFVNRKSDRPRMVWKMKMDLSAPLVASEGNLDPIDGYVIFRLLQATAVAQSISDGVGAADGLDQDGEGGVLQEEISDYKRVMQRKGEHFVSTDPLDLGMTLWTVHWFSEREEWAARIARRCFEQICIPPFVFVQENPVLTLYSDNLMEINRFLERPIKYRLAFREFGTCLGILCHSEQESTKQRAIDLKVYADAILRVWDPYMDLTLSSGLTDDDLRPINRVMYASALIPGGKSIGPYDDEHRNTGSKKSANSSSIPTRISWS